MVEILTSAAEAASIPDSVPLTIETREVSERYNSS